MGVDKRGDFELASPPCGLTYSERQAKVLRASFKRGGQCFSGLSDAGHNNPYGFRKV